MLAEKEQNPKFVSRTCVTVELNVSNSFAVNPLNEPVMMQMLTAFQQRDSQAAAELKGGSICRSSVVAPGCELKHYMSEIQILKTICKLHVCGG